MQTSEYPFRKVLDTHDTTTRYNRIGEGSRWHLLECGHKNVTKQSYGYPKKMRCRDCYYQAKNG